MQKYVLSTLMGGGSYGTPREFLHLQTLVFSSACISLDISALSSLRRKGESLQNPQEDEHPGHTGCTEHVLPNCNGHAQLTQCLHRNTQQTLPHLYGICVQHTTGSSVLTFQSVCMHFMEHAHAHTFQSEKSQYT